VQISRAAFKLYVTGNNSKRPLLHQTLHSEQSAVHS